MIKMKITSPILLSAAFIAALTTSLPYATKAEAHTVRNSPQCRVVATGHCTPKRMASRTIRLADARPTRM